MLLTQYLIETFSFNDQMNRKVLERVRHLQDKSYAIRLFSHLINCQLRWMARIKQDGDAAKMSWWEPVYELDELEVQWTRSLQPWFDYINSTNDADLTTEVTFVDTGGHLFAATPGDIALQLNYHSIHHRAQIQTIIRQQGQIPDFVDFVGTKYRKLN